MNVEHVIAEYQDGKLVRREVRVIDVDAGTTTVTVTKGKGRLTRDAEPCTSADREHVEAESFLKRFAALAADDSARLVLEAQGIRPIVVDD